MPEKIGKYEIRAQIGRGAMGTVFEGFDTTIGRRVAVKMLRTEVFDARQLPDVRARFKREAQAAGRLSHPHIVTIHDYGEEAGTPYIAMEFIAGQELASPLDRGSRFALDDVVRIMSQILGALAHAHDNGVVHRDLKPSNIFLLPDGSPKVVDFGIARVEASDLTDTGTVLGTPAYMSPEQCLGTRVDQRSDVYSAGVILYQFLTGEKPFTGSVTSIIQKVLHQEPMPPSGLNPTLSSVWDRIVANAMAKRPEKRYASARQFAEAIKAAHESTASGKPGGPAAQHDQTTVRIVAPEAAAPRAAPAGEQDKPPSARPGRTMLWPAIGGAAAVAVAGIALFVSSRAPAPAPATQASAATNAPVPERERLLWESVRNSADREDLRTYLAQYPDGVYSPLAKSRLARLDAAEAGRKEEAQRADQARQKAIDDIARLRAEAEAARREAQAQARAAEASRKEEAKRIEESRRAAEEEAKKKVAEEEAKKRAAAEEAKKRAVAQNPKPVAVATSAPSRPQSFAFEDKDWGVAPTATPQGPPFGKPTPTSIPGARVIRTLELKTLLGNDKRVVVIDVLDSKDRTTVPGAFWMPGAGDSRFYGAEERRFSVAMDKLTGGDKTRTLVFLCLSSQCWESYNAALHALKAGYERVLWYRGGTNAWSGANLERKKPKRIQW